MPQFSTIKFFTDPDFHPLSGNRAINKDSGLQQWELKGNLVVDFVCNGTLYRLVIPKGFVTDFASIPWWARWRYDPTDPRWRAQSVIHDYLYTMNGSIICLKFVPRTGWRDVTLTLSRQACDVFYRDAIKANGTDSVDAYIQYYAIRVGGGGRWKTKSRKS